MKDIEALVRPNIRQLCPYSTARDEYKGALGVFLDANESPYPSGWNRYPDPRQAKLKAAIAPLKKVAVENIFLGNGSDEAIDLVFRVFCVPGKDNVVAIEPSYGMYSVCARINDIELRSARLREDFSLDADAVLSMCDAHTKAIFLCSPNNPSGNCLERAAIERLLSESGCIVVVDEAYNDFSNEQSLLGALGSWPNLIVLQTFSKARGLAALRLGLAFAQPRTIELMSMVKYPYNINEATQKLALEALANPIDAQVREIVQQRGVLAEKFKEFACIKKIYPSQANFILVKVDDADRLYGHLVKDGIIVRNRNKVTGCAGCLRITVGLKEENNKLIESLKEYEKGNIH